MTELQAAAERLRRLYPLGKESLKSVYGRDGAGGNLDKERDIAECGYAFVAEHSADDGELLTVDWLDGLSRTDGGDMSFLAVRLCEDRTFHLMLPGKRPTEGVQGLRDFVSGRPSTRGDVRAICRALDIPLAEKGAG